MNRPTLLPMKEDRQDSTRKKLDVLQSSKVDPGRDQGMHLEYRAMSAPEA
jgi:hypothetical protein